MSDRNEHTILHVEDDDSCAYLFALIVEEIGCSVSVHRVRDGDQALQFLRREGAYQDAPMPDLVILDLSMPLVDGWEVLKGLRAEDDLRGIPILVVSTSEQPDHKVKALEYGAREYLTKPLLIEDLYTAVKDVCSRFLTAVK